MKHQLKTVFDSDTLTAHCIIVRVYDADETPRSRPNTYVWCGREFGWRESSYLFNEPKRYSSKRCARAALVRIRAHERELGLHGRFYHG